MSRPKGSKSLGSGIYKHYPHQGFQKGYTRSETSRKKQRNSIKGKNHWNWKGIKKHSDGYILIYQPNHPFKDCKGYIFRSRFVIENYLGRYLKPTEQVHHKGIKYPIGSIENKQDDRPKNLKLFVNASSHTKFHQDGV